VAGEVDYPTLLRAAIKAAGSSRRKLSYELAKKTGNQQEDEYRSLGKYLSSEKPELPSRERAAILAVLLGEPLLALVNDARGRRSDRLAKVEAELAALRELRDDDLRGVLARLAALEEGQGHGEQSEAHPSTPQDDSR